MADYHLHVELLVAERDAEEFERRVRDPRLTALFAPFEWELLLGLRGTKPYPFSWSGTSGSKELSGAPRKPISCRRFVNIWDIRDAVNVAELMQQLTDSDLYEGINALVVREVQNLVVPIRPTLATVAAGDVLVEVQRRFLVPNLGRYIFQSGITVPILGDLGWGQGGCYQAVTGHLNSITEVWRAPRDFKPRRDWTAGEGAHRPSFFSRLRPEKGPRQRRDGIDELFEKVDGLATEEWCDLMTVYVERQTKT
jgi:hypothetical protein